MAAEDLLVYNGCNGQAVEAVSERFPQFDVVASLACTGEGDGSQGRPPTPRNPQASILHTPGYCVGYSGRAVRKDWQARKA